MSTTTLRPPFARNLRHALAERKLTQEAFARQLDIATRTVSGWCLGQTQPSRKHLTLLTGELQVDADWLFSEHGFGTGE